MRAWELAKRIPKHRFGVGRLAASSFLATAALILVACDPGSGPDGKGRAVGVPPPTVARTDIATTTLPPSDAAPGCPDARPADDPGVRGLTDLMMVSAEKGFAVGQDVILVTDDGQSWRPRYADTAWLLSVEAVDADHAWAVGQNTLLATVDGGNHWFPVGQPIGANLRAVDFVDPSSGWGSDGQHVYRTVDGGQSWVRSDPPCGAERICFAGADEGWAARDRRLFSTSDGGVHWTASFTLPLPASTNEFNSRSVSIDALECADGGVAWVTFAGQSSGHSEKPYVVYRGRADGPWVPVLSSPGDGPPAVSTAAGGAYPAPLDAVDAGTAVFTSFTPDATPSTAVTAALRSGAVSGPWYTIPALYGVTSLSFPAPTIGWALGTRAGVSGVDTIVATSDSGRTWREQLSRPVPPPAS